MRQIRRLSLNENPITDKGLAHLSTLSHLRYLSLDDTQITDDGLKMLHTSQSLEWISLRRTRTTTAGVENLRAALPHLSVIDADENEWPPLRAKD